jgi:hypothetical protein
MQIAKMMVMRMSIFVSFYSTKIVKIIECDGNQALGSSFL